jgi:hypothetical protein
MPMGSTLVSPDRRRDNPAAPTAGQPTPGELFLEIGLALATALSLALFVAMLVQAALVVG